MKHLYHYRKYTESHLVSLLRDGSIKLSRPDTFNDPWDCRVKVRMPKDEDEIQRQIEYFKILHRRIYKNISEEIRLQLADELLNSPEKFKNALCSLNISVTAALSKQYRVLCLSEKSDCVLMWGHYGDAQKGICIEFYAKKFPIHTAIKVKYFNEWPEYDYLSNSILPLIAKSEHWSYEKEWRLIAEEQAQAMSEKTLKTNADFMKVPVEAICSIITGPKMLNEDIETIKRISSEHAPKITVKSAIASDERFLIHISG